MIISIRINIYICLDNETKSKIPSFRYLPNLIEPYSFENLLNAQLWNTMEKKGSPAS
jgi:hypothetical protein